jgi:hypothetical protein
VIVRVGGSPQDVLLDEPDDFTNLHVVAASLDQACAVPGVSPAGDGPEVWLSISALRAWAGVRPAGWQDGFDQMIAAAGRFGWLDDSASRVRAHVEPEQEEQA